MRKSNYVKSAEEIKQFLSIYSKPRFYDVNTLFFLYETKPEAIAALLPPPLVPSDPPIVTVNSWLVARSNCILSFNGSAVFVPCKYQDQQGAYCVHMVMDTDQAIIFGRELMAEPKKYAKTTHARNGSQLQVRVERLGQQYLTVTGNLTGPANIAEMPTEQDLFYFKFLPACDGSGLEFDPILTKTHFSVAYNWLEQGQGQIDFLVSDHDFLYELECVNPAALFYGNINIDGSTQRLTTVPAQDFLPYAFGKIDDWRLLNNIG
ncbi:MAG: acetoacetate decarboxylase family protein [Syntrophobacteraceae bacterium]